MLGKQKFDKNITDKHKKSSKDWLKAAGYLDTENQNLETTFMYHLKKQMISIFLLTPVLLLGQK